MTTSLPLFGDRLDPNLEREFGSLCDNLPPGEIQQLKEAVQSHVQNVRDALKHNEFLDVSTAEAISRSLTSLLDDYTSLESAGRKLVVGATRYFIHEQDQTPDTASILGLDDDVQVLNYVLTQIGRADLKVEF